MAMKRTAEALTGTRRADGGLLLENTCLVNMDKLTAVNR